MKLTALFAANHKAIFPSAALLTWCVLAYLCVDFGFWHKLFQLKPEDNAVYRAATEHALPQILASGRWDLIAEGYRSMARTEFEQGDEPDRVERALAWSREAATAELKRWADGRVATTGCGCDACGSSTGPVEVARELAAQRLPHPDCATGWCPCVYRPARGLLGNAFGRAR